MESLLLAAAALACGVISVLVALLVMRRFEDKSPAMSFASDMIAPCVFLFRDGDLVDATAPARTILSGCSAPTLAALKPWLSRRFDDLSALDRVLDEGGEAEIAGRGGSGAARMRLTVTTIADGVLRLSLIGPDSETSGIVVDSLSQQALEEELELLRSIVEDFPALIFRRDRQGQIVWANDTYLQIAEQQAGRESDWPLPEILIPDATQNAAGSTCRARLDDPLGTRWFECHDHDHAGGSTTYALPADATVQVEESLRNFLQTLTKTFAELPIGLAIFDRGRQLQLFNPALIDLTGLSAGFLTSRPSLYSVLDQLRELRMVPEPRDYRSWRKQITTLEAAAAAGYHAESWSLPGGRTYRVTGRPHPGGAIAFLFEDITTEVSLTRKFRAELALGTQVLDGLEQALIVFNAVGQTVTVNRAYRELRTTDPPERVAEALRQWQGEWNEAPGLSQLETALTRADEAGQDQGVIFGPGESGVLHWVVTALPGGKRMLQFAATAAASSATGGEAETEDAGNAATVGAEAGEKIKPARQR
ncbi:PAS domain-containing protein [Paracoccus isoporae]|uniref:PAS domain-containing protein n=1 Tax=Paracoccus isoporae TaxID=591205 RepID=A0A1G6UXC9_9RHOB|nr:PAS-domain containing protein [Paracoccus isoporae]SDD45386.1 PAS domain-containing protein [Paracoccus isoporae]